MIFHNTKESMKILILCAKHDIRSTDTRCLDMIRHHNPIYLSLMRYRTKNLLFDWTQELKKKQDTSVAPRGGVVDTR